MYEEPERESLGKVWLQQLYLEAQQIKLEDQADWKQAPVEERSRQLDVVWQSKQGSQEQYKGSSILTAPHDALTKEKSCAPIIEMVDQSVGRCRDG